MKSQIVDVLVGAVVLSVLALLGIGAWTLWRWGYPWAVWPAIVAVLVVIAGAIGSALRNA